MSIAKLPPHKNPPPSSKPSVLSSSKLATRGMLVQYFNVFKGIKLDDFQRNHC